MEMQQVRTKEPVDAPGRNSQEICSLYSMRIPAFTENFVKAA